MLKFLVERTFFNHGENGFTLGEISLNGARVGYTVEDEDRHLELDGEKVYGKTCIPRGTYRVVVDFSHRFQKLHHPLAPIVAVCCTGIFF